MIISVILLILALLIVVVEPTNEENRWLGIFVAFLSYGYLIYFIGDNNVVILNIMKKYGFFVGKKKILVYIYNISLFIFYNITPYALIVFAFVVAKDFVRKLPKIFMFYKVYLFIPVIITFYFQCSGKEVFEYIVYWVILYLAVSIYLLLKSCLLDKNRFVKKSKIQFCKVFIPLIICFVFANYIAKISR